MVFSVRAPVAAAAAIATVVLSGSCRLATASAVSSALGAIREAYTTNAICGKKNCINPVFPGMEDLHLLQQSKWICSSTQKTSQHMGFCRHAITYDVALPVPQGTGGAEVKDLVQRQDNAASTMFYYHLNGLGLEAWDYQKPEFTSNDCIKSIWRMACFTYFPRAQVGCQDGSFVPYLRPCKSSCMNYVRACGVECCDESVQCVFQHTKKISQTQVVTTEGYLPHDGPSSLCTGGARRSATPLGACFWAFVALRMLFTFDVAPLAGGIRSLFGSMRGAKKFLWVGTMLLVAVALQGCEYDVPIHRVGNWRGEPDYLITYEFIAPGGSAGNANLNSCSLSRLSQTLQCSGRGVCKMWDPGNLHNELTFCECDTDWADPECRTKRQSQTKAYFFSMFFGWAGLDQFYLGHTGLGVMKLFTLGGFGILWVYDIIRIGSAPVYASQFKVAADLPHFMYVLTSVMFAIMLGFAVAYNLTTKYRARKRREAMTLQSDEEARQPDATQPFADSLGPGLQKPMMQKDNMYGSFQQGGPMMGGPPGQGFPPQMGY